MAELITCTMCHGTGRALDEYCPQCGGTGQTWMYGSSKKAKTQSRKNNTAEDTIGGIIGFIVFLFVCAAIFAG